MRLLIRTLDILVWFLKGKSVMGLTIYSDIEPQLLGCLYRSNSRRIHRMSYDDFLRDFIPGDELPEDLLYDFKQHPAWVLDTTNETVLYPILVSATSPHTSTSPCH